MLITYHQKRNFKKTPEPAGKQPTRQKNTRRFVIQKHDASHLHYDFRLELKGVLVSWAVPKGPCLDPQIKRLAVHVEDHPLAYASFEGRIPAGQYGAGTVMIWDEGEWISEDPNPLKAYHAGHMTFTLRGKKLKGKWKLIHMKKDDAAWLLMKVKDEFAKSIKQYDILVEAPASATSDRSLEKIKQPKKSRSKKMAKTDPFPRVISPQLAFLVDKPPSGNTWLHEVKFDGYRILAFKKGDKIKLLTRQHQDWTEKFPNIVKQLQTLPVQQAVLDGEMVVLNEDQQSDFQLLQNTIKAGKKMAFLYYVFDLIYHEQQDLSDLPLIKRKSLLQTLLPSNQEGPLVYSDHLVGSGKDLFKQCCTLGLEGLVSKDINSPYIQKRSKHWLKTKCLNRQEFVIGGFTKPRGSRSGFGALLIGTYNEHHDLIYHGKVGTGFTEDTLQSVHQTLMKQRSNQMPFDKTPPESKAATWVKPVLVAEIEFTQWTKEGRLRHPSFKGLRKDKSAKEVTRESQAPVESLVRESSSPYPLTHPEKVLYPEDQITKRDLAEYYETVAPWILPYLIDRPLTLVRCPDGYSSCFYQKHVKEAPSSLLKGFKMKEKNKTSLGVYIQNEKDLMALPQLGTLEIHPWGSRIEDIERPDIITFDLDPSPGVAWQRVVEAAFEMKKNLSEFKLKSFVKTTGGKGLHVVVPIQAEYDWEEVKNFAHVFVDFMVQQQPEHYVSKMTKQTRKGKIFLDYLRNQRGATAVAPYSTRARKHAPVSVPLYWNELTSNPKDTFWTIKTLPERLKMLKKDPWTVFFKIAQSLNLRDG